MPRFLLYLFNWSLVVSVVVIDTILGTTVAVATAQCRRTPDRSASPNSKTGSWRGRPRIVATCTTDANVTDFVKAKHLKHILNHGIPQIESKLR